MTGMTLFAIVVFILIIGILVFVHELGHFIAARAVGIKVEEFAIGMGPKLWSKKKNGILYSSRALPIGGYVKMYGEGDYDIKEENSFGGKKPTLRLIVLVAGVFMNFVLASLIFFAMGVRQDFRFTDNTELIANNGQDFKPWFGEEKNYVLISEISDSSVLKDQIEDYSLILKINGEDYDYENFRSIIESNKDKEIILTFLENLDPQFEQVKDITVKLDPNINDGLLGIAYRPYSFVKYEGIGIIGAGIGQTFNTIQSIGYLIGDFVSDSFKKGSIAPVADSFSGAYGIFEFLIYIIRNEGIWGVLMLMALFSANLALFNILPIPALDGGHVVFTLLEMIFRRKLATKIYNYITLAGFVILMSFMLIVTLLDLVKHTDLRNLFCNEDRQVEFICELSDYRDLNKD